jgi:acylglycerol lipase
MNYKNFYLEAFDGRKMFFNQWQGEAHSTANVVLIHGMGEHSGRYGHLAAYFVANQIDVYAVDLFGHGKTEGTKGHTPKIDDYLWQVDFLVNMIKQIGKPVFLYGHSMGGGVVLNYLFKRNPSIAGVIASAPAIEPAFEVPKAKLWMGKIGRKLFPSLSQSNGLDVNGISRDSKVINAYHADPLVHDIISAEVGIGVIEWGKWLSTLEKEKVSVPLLVMHGDRDILTSHSASEKFTSKFNAGDVTFKSWSGLFHELHNEPEKEEVFSYVVKWIKKRM